MLGIGETWSLIAASVALCACSPAPPPTPPEPADDVAAPVAPAADQAVYRLAWVSEEGLGDRVVVAPWGDVLVFGGGKIHLLARHDGSVLDSASVEHWTRGMGFVDDHTAVVVTMDGWLTEVRFPGLAMRGAKRVEGRVASAAMRPGRVAVGTEEGRLLVVATPSYEVLLDVLLAGDSRNVEHVALSPDGSFVAASLRSGGTFVYDVAANKVVVSRDGEMRALSISPDNARLFGDGPSKVTMISLKTGETLRELDSPGSLSASAFVSPQLMVGAGFLGGMQLFQPGRGEPEHLPAKVGDRDASPTRSVSVSVTQHMLCGGGVDGRVVCFSTRRLEPSQYRKPKSLVGEPWEKK